MPHAFSPAGPPAGDSAEVAASLPRCLIDPIDLGPEAGPTIEEKRMIGRTWFTSRHTPLR